MREENVVINTRTLWAPTTGVQRYTRELLNYFGNRCHAIGPKRLLPGNTGHLWEQLILPWRLKGRLLWSPANTGPLSVANQVVTIHDAATLDHPEWFAQSFACGYRLLLPRLIKIVRLIITDSEFSRQQLLAHSQVPAEKIIAIPLGVSNHFSPAAPDDLERVRCRYHLERPYLLALGSLEPRKNLNRLLTAWTQLRDRYTDIELLIVGGTGKIFRDPCYGPIPHGVRFLGYVEDQDLPALFSGAMIFVYPSIYEGFGLPPLEAMACGSKWGIFYWLLRSS